MTDAEMAEAVADAEHYLAVAGRSGLPSMATLCHALIESRRQVAALTSVLDAIAAAVDAFEGNQPPQYAPGEYDHAALAKTAASVIRDDSTSALGLADRLRAERDAATARAERAEQARFDAVAIAARLEAEDYRSMPKLHQRDRTVAATERARVVEAIAAKLEKTGNLVANTLSPDDDRETCMDVNTEAQTWEQAAVAVRATNWAPPEEDGNE